MNTDFFKVGKCYKDKEEGTFIYMRIDSQDGDVIYGAVVELWENMVSIKEDYPLNRYMYAEDAVEVTQEDFLEAVDIAMIASKNIISKIKKVKKQ